MDVIENDGRIVNGLRDPPGQRSVYIRPGDIRSEVYRLTTFGQFPSMETVDPCLLAKHRFFYLGYKDRVKCFDCAQTIQDWTRADDPTLSKWHLGHCQFVQDKDYTNIPIQSRRRSTLQSASQKSSSTSASSSQNVEPQASLAQHSRDDLSLQPAGQLLVFPCDNPVNLHMSTSQARLSTFYEHIRSWPQERFAATPEDMVEAGLHYLGDHDRVKCWYCDGGLQNWDRYDSPWSEHANWFPQCEYLLQKKGTEFVENIFCRFPNLNRPQLSNPVSLLDGSNQVSNPTGIGCHKATDMQDLLGPQDSAAKLCVDININKS